MKKMTAARLDTFGCLMLMAASVMPLDITDVELTEERGTIPSMKNPESRTDKVLFFIYILMLGMYYR